MKIASLSLQKIAGSSSGETGPSSIDPKWAWHYRVLVALRARLDAELHTRRSEASGPIEPHGLHPADSGTDEFDHDLAFTLLVHKEDALREVSEAIERIRGGTYGVCLTTGTRIPPSRLRALPWCRYTREVEEALETTGRQPKLQLPAVKSVRRKAATIPGTGDIVREGSEHEAKKPEEPKAGKQLDDAATPGMSDADSNDG